MQAGDTIELIQDTAFYKKGKKATVICPYDRASGNPNKVTIRFEGEEDITPDADVYPKELFRVISSK